MKLGPLFAIVLIAAFTLLLAAQAFAPAAMGASAGGWSVVLVLTVVLFLLQLVLVAVFAARGGRGEGG